MLSFAPPIRLIAGHPVFADHQDGGLFHVLPAAPMLAERADGAPDFGLMRYLGDGPGGEALAGGFLSLATVLAVPAAAQAEITARLTAELGRPVRLSLPLFDDGQVELTLLGSGTAAGSPFEVEVLGSARPSMAGENTASFQVALNANASAFVEASIGDPTLPALIVYRMALSGLQPAYRVRVSGDLARLERELDSRFRANVYYVRADIAAQTRDALGNAGIQVDTVIMDGEAASDAAAAEQAVLDWLTETFFDAAYGAQPPAPAPAAGVVDSIAGSVMDLVDTLMPGASFKLKTRRESDIRQMDAVLNRTTVRRRDLVFQSALGHELYARRVDEDGVERPGWPALRDRMIGGVNIKAIPRREVRIGAMDRFASDGLSAVEVEIALPDPAGAGPDLHPAGFIFRDGAARQLYAVNLLDAPPALLTEAYRYRLRCHFDPASPFGQRPPETGPWIEGRAAELIVDPRVDGPYRLRAPVIGLAPGFPFAQFAQVSVDLRRMEGEVEAQRDSALLSAEKPETTWTFRGHGADPEQFQYRLQFERPVAQGGPVVTDWRREAGLRVTLPDPLPHRRRATFFVSLPWAEVQMAFLEIRYDDPAHGLRIDERVNLSAEAPLVERDYAIADPAVAAITYRLTALIAGRGFVQGDWRETLDTTIAVGRELVEMRAVRFRAVGLPLAQHRLSELQIRAEALGADGGLRHQHRITVPGDQSGTDLGTWTFPRFAPEVARLRIKADWRDRNGFPNGGAWTDWDRDLVLIRVPQMTFQA